MNISGTVDVSCYLCFEATGDSEVPSCDPINEDPNIACQIPNWDDDDAQSCCYDTSDESLINSEELINEYEPDDEQTTEDDDKVELCVYGTTYKNEEQEEEDCEMQKKKKMRVCVDQKMDEMEKNRLFWETCLAS